MSVEVVDRFIAAGLGLPAAFQPAIAIGPMTDQYRGWNPALALRAAKTRKVVVGMDFVERPSPPQRNAPPLPESSNFEVCKA